MNTSFKRIFFRLMFIFCWGFPLIMPVQGSTLWNEACDLDKACPLSGTCEEIKEAILRSDKDPLAKELQEKIFAVIADGFIYFTRADQTLEETRGFLWRRVVDAAEVAVTDQDYQRAKDMYTALDRWAHLPSAQEQLRVIQGFLHEESSKKRKRDDYPSVGSVAVFVLRT